MITIGEHPWIASCGVLSVALVLQLAVSGCGRADATMSATGLEDSTPDGGPDCTRKAGMTGDPCTIVDDPEPAPPPDRPCLGPCGDEDSRPVPLDRPLCPEDEPRLDDDCESDGLICGYGEERNVECRRYYECAAKWRMLPRDHLPYWSCELAKASVEECPNEVPEDGSACTVLSPGPHLACPFDDQDCYCRIPEQRSGPGGPGSLWRCYGAPQDTRCPARLPNLGEGCTPDGLACNYVPYGCYFHPNTGVLCVQGAWEDGADPQCEL